MNGQITKYREDLGVGVIQADDGRKYRFSESDVVNADDDIIGQSVDFVASGRRPIEIIVMSGSPWTVFGRA